MRRAIKVFIKKIRSACTSWMSERTLEHLESIRKYELEKTVKLLPPKGKILEIGAGTGWQAKSLQDMGYDVNAIDIAGSEYSMARVWPVVEYDGKKIPYGDHVFDIVFSSNVLEHVHDIYDFQYEIRRVLKKDGVAVHVLPSGSWRFWTNITHCLEVWTVPDVHGEHAGNALSEIYYFSRMHWIRLFRKTGWEVVSRSANRLFYTGRSIMDDRLSINTRIGMSRVLGSSCNIFVLRNRRVS
jgi:2-polyprenyl-3-methyl-5-hydroxy-6-metoxy-1,4-benzoquinol methylase